MKWGASLVDVVIATHDPRRPAARAVASVLDGNTVPVRTIVVAHNRPPSEIARSLGHWAEDDRVLLAHWEDGVHSPSGPMNHGFDLARAPYVALLGSDDTLSPGALDRWVRIAEDEQADFVIANRREPEGNDAATPPVRPGRREGLNGVKDRLAYRAAPLGLIRRSRFGHLRFPVGVPTGEDIPFSSYMWFTDAKIAFAFGEPGYVVHADQEERATTTIRTIGDSLLWMDEVLDLSAPWMRKRLSRRALMVKLLRHNIPDAAAAVLPGGWDDRARQEMRQALLRIHRAEPSTPDYLSRADWRLLTALVSGQATEDEIVHLLEARRKVRTVDSLVPHQARLLLSRQGPLRTHIAGAALAHARPTKLNGNPAVSVSGKEGARAPEAKRMVFHAPFPVEDGATSASGIRPWKMLQAFRDLGYDVFAVTGYAKERKGRLAELRKKMAAGWCPQFCYSEAATIPSSFTEPKHVPLILNLDRSIFRFFHGRDIPIGVFYRDVYWAFPEYVSQVGKPVATAMRYLYQQEITTFNKYANVVFLPTQQMSDFVPGLEVSTVALPPGADGLPPSDPSQQDAPRRVAGPSQGLLPEVGQRPLRLFYVGAVGGEHYDISALLRAVNDTDGVMLTICTRPDSWQTAKQEYAALLSDRVHVVHESGEGLEPLYQASDVACLVMRPQQYRSFAAPMKLYEYLGQGKPVLASAGTHAAQVVKQTGAGWVAPFDPREIAQQLRELRDDPGLVAEKTQVAREQRSHNTWAARADFAARVLTELPGSARPAGSSSVAVVDSEPKEDPHVLVIPSWYPQDRDDAHGSFFREQAEALGASGMAVGVLALTEEPVYSGGRSSAEPLSVTEENGLNVIRGTVPRWLPMQRALNVWLVRRQLEQAWDTYVSRFGVPDVIHAHSLYPGAFLARELSRSHDIPFVYTEHRTLNHMPVRTRLGGKIEREVAASAASRHAVSRGHAEHLARRFGLAQWDYIPNLLPAVVETGGDDVAPQTPHDGGYIYGHLSVLDPVKRVDRLIDAFAVVHAEDDSTRLLIGGSGPELPGLEQRVENLGLEGAVEFLGQLSRDEVADFYRQIDAFVLPSYTEPMGVVQVEALASGVPVISTRTWGGETVIGEGDGLLVDIDDHHQLVDAMRQIRADAGTAQDRLDRRERAIDRFGRKAFVDRYREIYRQASQRRGLGEQPCERLP